MRATVSVTVSVEGTGQVALFTEALRISDGDEVQEVLASGVAEFLENVSEDVLAGELRERLGGDQ